MHHDSCTSRASFVLFDDGARFQTYAHFAAMLHTHGDSPHLTVGVYYVSEAIGYEKEELRKTGVVK